MQIEIKRQFIKDLEPLPKSIRAEIEEVIVSLENASSLLDVQSIKKLQGYQNYFRLRVGNYRIGFTFVNEIIVLARCLHGKEIYRHFP